MAARRIVRAGVIGDIHGEVEALQAALDFLSRQPLDILLCTGDIVTGEGDANRCCELLEQAGVLCVRGNHDRWFLQESTPPHERAVEHSEIAAPAYGFLESLPVTREFDTPAGRILLCHGLGDDDMAGVYAGDEGLALERNYRLHALVIQADYPIVINGHTHQRMVRTIEGMTIINAGTLRNYDRPCFLTVDFAAGEVQFYDIAAGGIVSAGAVHEIAARPGSS